MSFWYHGRMWDENDIDVKIAQYEAIIKRLEEKIDLLELENEELRQQQQHDN